MKILVVKLSSLGDLFHALPAVHNVKVGLKAEIHWVVQDEYVELVKCFTDVDRVIPVSRRQWFRGLRVFLRRLRLYDYDYVVDLQGLLKSAFVAALARGRRRIGPSFCREGSILLYSAVAGPADRTRHAVDQCMDTARYFGLSCLSQQFPVVFPPAARSEPRPRVGLLPVSRWETKNWPADRFVAVARRLQQERDATIFLLGGASDATVSEEQEKAIGGRVVNLCGKLTIPESGAVIRELDLLIANDSGPVHMAAAVGTPTLVIFGPTDPRRTGPYGTIHRVVRGDQPCQPCYRRTCKFVDMPCMKDVTAERVGDEALQLLEASQRRAGATREQRPVAGGLF
jgi:lipopolysaccharide heptosyltransferase I